MIVIDVSDRTAKRARPSPAYIDLTRHHQAMVAEQRSVTALLHLVVILGLLVMAAFDYEVGMIVMLGLFGGERIYAARAEYKNSRLLRRDLA